MKKTRNSLEFFHFVLLSIRSSNFHVFVKQVSVFELKQRQRVLHVYGVGLDHLDSFLPFTKNKNFGLRNLITKPEIGEKVAEIL